MPPSVFDTELKVASRWKALKSKIESRLRSFNTADLLACLSIGAFGVYKYLGSSNKFVTEFLTLEYE